MAIRESSKLYRAIVDQVADRIAFLGLTMWQVDDKAGVPDGYTAKMLHPDTPSGRQATWPMLQLIIDALWPEGIAFVLIPRAPRRKPYRNRRMALGLDKLPPHPASVRPKQQRKAKSGEVINLSARFMPKPVKPLPDVIAQAKPLIRLDISVDPPACVAPSTEIAAPSRRPEPREAGEGNTLSTRSAGRHKRRGEGTQPQSAAA